MKSWFITKTNCREVNNLNIFDESFLKSSVLVVHLFRFGGSSMFIHQIICNFHGFCGKNQKLMMKFMSYRTFKETSDGS